MLLLNSPLSEPSLMRLVARATDHRPQRVIDHGCGWGEVLLRTLEAVPEASGRGVEVHEPDVQRAQLAAVERGFDARVEFIHGSVVDHRAPADLLISVGAYQAFGDVGAALQCLRADLNTGGRVLFGLEYWESTPTPEELEHMWPNASLSDCWYLPDLVDGAHEAGWKVLDLYVSTQTEFDDFELSHLRQRERQLADSDGQPARDQIAAAWSSWLRGHRRPMGFVTFVLR